MKTPHQVTALLHKGLLLLCPPIRSFNLFETGVSINGWLREVKHLPKVTQPASSRAGVQTQVCEPPVVSNGCVCNDYTDFMCVLETEGERCSVKDRTQNSALEGGQALRDTETSLYIVD